jgi:hypothetical protein
VMEGGFGRSIGDHVGDSDNLLVVVVALYI